MLTELNELEARVIGCLMEKSVVTPDGYPLTLNALTNACNQKSSRDPVMSLTSAQVQHTVRLLEAKHLLVTDENFKNRTEKYTQRFCNTRYSNLQFDAAEFAVVCLLLLRGPQTPGELKSRSGRLHVFADNAEVSRTIDGLIEQREGEPLLVRLPRSAGRRDAEVMHLFCGPVEVPETVAVAAAASPAPRATKSELEDRVAKLEEAVAELRQQLAEAG